MTPLVHIRAQGFTLWPVPDDGLYIEPSDALTDRQHQWLIEHMSQIRSELYAERWRWFLSLAADHGIHPDVVSVECPTDDDRLDVIELTESVDGAFLALVASFCIDVRVRQRQREFASGKWTPDVDDGDLFTDEIAL